MPAADEGREELKEEMTLGLEKLDRMETKKKNTHIESL